MKNKFPRTNSHNSKQINKNRGRKNTRVKRKYTMFQKFNYFVRKHPLISGVGSIVSSIILIRVSNSNLFFGSNITEFRLWFLFFALLIGIIGVFSIWVWIKNNVSDLNTQHRIK